MNIQERQFKAKMRRRKQVARQKMVLLLLTVFLITIGSIIFGSIFSSANNTSQNSKYDKQYKSIVIEDGDSLWSIAEEYRTVSYKDTHTYVEELKTLNSLTSETIHEGQHLIVVCYE